MRSDMRMLCDAGIAAALAATTLSGQAADSTLLRSPTVLDARVTIATRTAQTVSRVPVNVAVIGPAQLELTAAKAISDLLRALPGFTTRDFQSSLTVHPTRTAPSIRGLGGTNASRMLVLLDGVPINDPFAGWVYWSRVPIGLVKQVEVVRGGGAGVWGDRAMAGVINMVTEQPTATHLTANISRGSMSTARSNVTATTRAGKLAMMGSADYLKTGGFINIRPDLRTTIDRNVDSRSAVAFGRVLFDVTPLFQLHASGSYLDDVRQNGSVLKDAATIVSDARMGGRYVTGGGSVITANAFGNRSAFDQFFTTESLDRRTETPSLDQFDVPSRAAGVQLQWARALRQHEATAGIDATWIDGEINEDFNYQQGVFTRRRLVSGEQRTRGIFVQDAVTISERLQLLASVRYDQFDTPTALRRERNIQTGALTADTTYPKTDGAHTSFSLGLRHRATDALAMRASVYRSFRVPTLNELYRPFREAGNVIVEANRNLEAEGLMGLDVGTDLRFGSVATARFTWFVNRVENPIFEMTVARAGTTSRTIAPCGFVPAGGVCRQRRAGDVLKSIGVESELELRPHADWTVAVSHSWNPAEVTKAPLDTALEGKRPRATPTSAGTLSLSYVNQRVVGANLTVRYVGRRFDDDLNSLPLAPFAVVDGRLNRRLTRVVHAFVSVENVLDREYMVTNAASGLVRIGTPRLVEGGVRFTW